MSLRLLRALKILRVALRYGLDEIVLSAAAVPPRWRVVSGLFFWRELRAPRGERGHPGVAVLRLGMLIG